MYVLGYSIRPIFVLLERNCRSTNRNSIVYDTGVTGKKVTNYGFERTRTNVFVSRFGQSVQSSGTFPLMTRNDNTLLSNACLTVGLGRPTHQFRCTALTCHAEMNDLSDF